MIRSYRSSLAQDFRESLGRPAFWAFASWLDIAVRYRRTAMGYVWAFAPTTLFVCVLGGVYAGLMGYKSTEYLPFLAVGYLLWRFLIQGAIDAASIIRNHKAFLQEGRLNILDLLLRVIVRGMVYFCFGLPVLIGVFIWSDAVSVISLANLLLMLPLFIYVLAMICLHIALLGARTPDTAEVITTAMMFAFLLTPIMWYPTQAHGGVVLQVLTKINPLAHMIEMVRKPALGGGLALQSTGLVAAFGLALTISGHYLYRAVGRYVTIWL